MLNRVSYDYSDDEEGYYDDDTKEFEGKKQIFNFL